MRNLILVLLLYIAATPVRSQHTFRGTSLSEALIRLDQSSSRFDINFVYNELEDFTVTKTIKRGRSLPDAVRDVCGFYPVKVWMRGHDIYVECVKKDSTKLIGRLVDEEQQPVAYANILLFHPTDTVVIGGGVSNESGDFIIPCSSEKVRVRISCVGFKTIERTMPVSHVGTISMEMANNYLGNIPVSGRMPIIRHDADRLQYIVANDPFAKGHTVMELMNRVPMVSTAGNSVSILGKGEAGFMLNGRVMELSEEAIRQKLWSLHAEDIKCIEVISIPSGRNLTGMGNGYINIITNHDQALGWRGDVTTHQGYHDDWSGRLSGSVNYASEKFDMAVDLGGNWLSRTTDKHTVISNGNSAPEADNFTYSSTVSERTKDRDISSSMTLRYQPVKSVELGASAFYQHLWPERTAVSDNLISGFDTDQAAAYINAYGSEAERMYAGSHVLDLSAYLDWTLGRPGRKLSLSYSFYGNEDANESKASDKKQDNPRLLHYLIECSYDIHSTRLDLSLPSPSTSVDAGVAYTTISNEGGWTSYSYLPYPIYGFHGYEYGEKTFAAYLSLGQNLGKGVKATGTIRYERTRLNGNSNSSSTTSSLIYIEDGENNRSYDNFLPSLSLSYLSESGQQLRASWGMTISRPKFLELNPLHDFNSSYDDTYGNPALLPSYENRVELSYHNHNNLYVNLYHVHGRDQIDWTTSLRILENHIGFLYKTPMNCFKSDRTGLYLRYSQKLAEWWNMTADGDLYYFDATQAAPGFNDSWSSWSQTVILPKLSTSTSLHGWGKRLSVSTDMFLNQRRTLLLNARYDHHLNDYVGLTETDSYGYFSFALRYALLDDRMRLSLVADDPFRQHVTDATKDINPYIRQYEHINHHSHYIGITATYSFGGKTVRRVQHREVQQEATKRAER